MDIVLIFTCLSRRKDVMNQSDHSIMSSVPTGHAVLHEGLHESHGGSAEV